MLVEPVATLSAGLDAALGEWAAVSPTALSPAALVNGLDEMHAAECRLRALQAEWLAAADAADAVVTETGRATRWWLIEEQRQGPAEAGRRMRLARGMAEAPLVAAALRAGDINPDHALLILGVLPHTPDDLRGTVEDALVDLARTRPPFLVGRAVDHILEMLGVDGESEAARERRYAERGVGVDETIGGIGSLNGTLTPEVREKLTLALDTAGTPAADDPRSRRQRWHDALGEIAGFYLAHTDAASPVNGERPRIVVTIDYDALVDRLHERWATLDTGLQVSPATARRLACDAEILPAVLRGRSEVLDIGRAARSFTTATRRAAWLRDGGRCTYPRCSRPPRELHHVVHWANGGASNLDNAAWLCTFHHWLVHEGRWSLRRDPDGQLVFTALDGHQRDGPRHPEAA